jgi:hypothetical protein
MMTNIRRAFLRALAWLPLCFSLSAAAACHNPKDWLEAPSKGVKVFVGYRHPQPNTPSSEERHIGFPPPLPPAMLEKPWEGDLAKEEPGETSAFVSYFEPDGRGQWRLCREESWHSKEKEPFSDNQWYMLSDAAHRNVPALAPWLKTHYSSYAKMFKYDKLGRLAESFAASMRDDGLAVYSLECWRYDDRNRVTLQLKPDQTEACPTGEPDTRDFYYYREFFDFTEPDGSPASMLTWDEINFGDEDDDGGWVKNIHFARLIDPGNPIRQKRFQGGNARADSKRGVLYILGGGRLGERENSIGQSFKYASGGSPPIEYLFLHPEPVPHEMLRDPDNIYKYNRRRDTDITRVIRLHEYFPANQTRIRERFFTAFARTLRHEQLDGEGRLRRAINVGRFSRTDEKYGFYDEDLESAKISLKLIGRELYYRVWEYDADGKATLAALGWGAWPTLLGKPAKIDEADIRFGTPDGTERWKTKEEFFAAFDFDPNAKRAFARAYFDRSRGAVVSPY